MPEPAADASLERGAAVERQSLAEDLVDAALAGVRQGSLEPLVLQRPRAARWLMRHWRPLLRGTAGDALGPSGNLVVEAAWLLRWGVTQLRPDRQPQLDGLGSDDWLQRPAWRPMLAVMCHARLAAVPDFPRHYRRRPDESPADNLCGLWAVDPSTFYRYVERGQRAMARLTLEPPSVPQRLALRRFVLDQLQQAGRWPGDAVRARWHREQALSLPHDPASALWHALQTAEPAFAMQVLLQHAAVLAGEPEVDALVDRVAALALSRRQQFDLWLARAALARTRQAPAHEEAACRQALQLAEAERQDLWRGIAQGALGRCFEVRDAERALAYYDESLRSLGRVVPGADDTEARTAALASMVRAAFMRVRRNDPAARDMLEEAGRRLDTLGSPDDQAGLLEQAWGLYWRVAGDVGRALQSWLRALTIFERIGDQRSVLRTYGNLMLAYADQRDIARVESCAERIFEVAARHALEAGLLISAHGNLGMAYSLIGRYDVAAGHFERALERAETAGHQQFVNSTRYNLANAFYNRFLATNDASFERRADELIQRVLGAPPATVSPSLLEEARGLKAQVLGRQPESSVDQLLDDESAAHLPEMAEIKRQRTALAAAGDDPAAQVEARLAITRAYLTIAAQEREAARDLIERHALQTRFAAPLDALRSGFEGTRSQADELAATWRQAAGDLLDDGRRARVVQHLLQHGSVNKSGYGELAGVAPATASKHLAALAERGLLVQHGKGPSTRYQLPHP